MKSFTTNGGKKLDLFIDPKTSHVRARFNPGGELPVELSGVWTNENAASKDIIIYLNKKK